MTKTSKFVIISSIYFSECW